MREIRKNYVIYPRVKTKPVGNSRTKQSFKDDSNINNIMARYEKTEVIDHLQEKPGRFLDLPSGLDYQTAMNMSINARDAFDGLPGTIRAKFQNDPKTFFEFMEDSENDEEIMALGLRPNEDPIPAEPPEVSEGTDVVEPPKNTEPAPGAGEPQI